MHQTFASVVGGEKPFWSVLVLYEDRNAVTAESSPKSEKIEAAQNISNFIPEFSKPVAPKREIATMAFAAEPVKLTAEQENSYNALRSWRNERASQDGVPPYLLAHNDSLMQVATMNIKTLEDLLQVKGLGEKRVQKYGDEILRILSSTKI